MPVGGGHGQMSRGLFSGCGQSLYRSPRPSAACPPTRLPRRCAGVREPARTARRCKRQTEPSGLQRSRATGQVRTSPARPWSRRRSGLPAFSASGYTLHVIPFEPELITEPSDGARLDALRQRLGDTSCRQRGHMTAIVSRAVPWRISVRRADACNPAARSDRAIGSARRSRCSQTSVEGPLQRPQARSPEPAFGAAARIVRVWTQNANLRCPMLDPCHRKPR